MLNISIFLYRSAASEDLYYLESSVIDCSDNQESSMATETPTSLSSPLEKLCSDTRNNVYDELKLILVFTKLRLVILITMSANAEQSAS